MSTSEPGESPSFAAPQDPWSGTQGIAAAPTDPIPAPGYAQGVAAPVPPSVWSQETIAQNDPYGYPPRKRGALRYLIAALVVLVVGGVGAYGAWYLTLKNYHPQPATQSHGPSASVSSSPSSSGDAVFDPASVQLNDCLTSSGAASDLTFHKVNCTAGALQVIKIAHGPDLPKNSKGEFDDNTVSTVCTGTGYSNWFGWNSSDNSQDYIWCLKAIK